jgi:hypothetical protein
MGLHQVLGKSHAHGWLHVIRERVSADGAAFQITIANQVRLASMFPAALLITGLPHVCCVVDRRLGLVVRWFVSGAALSNCLRWARLCVLNCP